MKNAEAILQALLEQRREMFGQYAAGIGGFDSVHLQKTNELQGAIDAIQRGLDDEKKRQPSVYERRGLAGFSE